MQLNQLGSNPDIFLPLSVNSTKLVKVHEHFFDHFRDLDMVNLYETRQQVTLRTLFAKVAMVSELALTHVVSGDVSP